MDTILIVEDEQETRLLIQENLKDEGYTFIEAGDGVEAQIIIKDKFRELSAVILDWKMPKLDGIDVLKWIKDNPNYEHLPVIMHTGMSEAEHIREGIEAGAYYYLMKPSQHELLVSVVKTAISDLKYKRALLRKLQEGGNPYSFLVEGTFRFHTIEEGEFLALRIAKACSAPDAALGISELLTNAVEHGNLNITYSEKSELVSKGSLQQTLQNRQALPENVAKFVEVHIKKHHDKMTILIEDHGQGFDFKNYLTLDEKRAFDNHGRGIAIARAYLSFKYLGNGNQVLVTIPFTK